MGYLVSSTFHNYATANLIAPILQMPFMLFSGFYANLNSIPAWLGWIKWTSPIHYCLQAFILNEFRSVKEGEFDIVSALGFTFGMWNSIILLLVITVVCRIAAIFALKNLITKF